MSKFKGTKKNWSLNDTDNEIFGGNDNYNHISAGNGVYNFDGNIQSGFTLTGYISKENSCLIASAPELLNALEQLMEVYEQRGNLLNFDINIARQAIKSALL